MEAARTSETLVNFYQTTRRYNPEGNHLHTRRRENLKSYSYILNPTGPPSTTVDVSREETAQAHNQWLTIRASPHCVAVF
jgi:hypothetical protein